MEPDRVLGALVVIATAAVLVAFYRMRDRKRAPEPKGVAVRVECPEDHQPAEVRIGKRSTGELAVLWCDRFADRPIGCRQACFIVMPEGNGKAAAAG